MSDKIVLSDRIKELSYTVGTGNFSLEGAANGFSTFASKYQNGDSLFYAITDGTRYEVGSGVYATGITGDYLVRFPFRSTNNDLIVSFPAGTKEVFVTYPATHSVFQGSGLSNLSVPKSSGVAFWSTENILDYDSNIVWDKQNNRLGINTSSPQYNIDIGGNGPNSIIRSSGVIVGSSGVQFPPLGGYNGGTQTEHFERNRLDQYAYDNSLLNHLTGTDAVFELSGVVNQYILFKQQNAGTVLAGPPSGCTPPCSPAYPTFRQLVIDDFPYLQQVSGILNTRIVTISGIAINSSGILNNKIDTVSGILNNNISTVSGMLVSTSGTLNNQINSASGIIENQIYDTEIYNLGTIGGIVPLNWAKNKLIQTANLNGVATTFTKGTGWPTTTTISRDLVLKLTTNTSTNINWTIIGSNWYNKPSGSILNSGEHMFVLRAFGNNIINGFYAGQNTGSL